MDQGWSDGPARRPLDVSFCGWEGCQPSLGHCSSGIIAHDFLMCVERQTLPVFRMSIQPGYRLRITSDILLAHATATAVVQQFPDAARQIADDRHRALR